MFVVLVESRNRTGTGEELTEKAENKNVEQENIEREKQMKA